MQLTDLKWPDIEALDKNTPVVFPLAALEQHGRHLPLFTDSILTQEITRRAAERVGDRALFAPLLWLGNSEHHLDFAGTLSAAPRAYIDIVTNLADNALRHGFRRLFFLNGHGGNEVPGKQALYEVRQRHRQRKDLLLLFGTYWNLTDKTRLSGLGFRQSALEHACEFETSMMLRVAPHLVDDISSLKPVIYGNPFEPASRAFIVKDLSAAGHIGQPGEATSAKGETLFEIFTEGVVSLLERVIAWNGKDWNG